MTKERESIEVSIARTRRIETSSCARAVVLGRYPMATLDQIDSQRAMTRQSSLLPRGSREASTKVKPSALDTRTHLVHHATEKSAALFWSQVRERPAEHELRHQYLIACVDFTCNASLELDHAFGITVT